ncbi:flagellin N-terminal helical domain-containing protein [Martelella alba]|uniref:Flagellin n=1 Tax=Martelella alba TaxID=2590451 RepID=A0ABY2SQE2_9HYPH|nr:flagellin [Martelella alba]TKI08269.1 flagellin FliC [Martelella alba]
MAQVINTNSISLMAQNNLNKSQSALGTAIERLSSGLRINSAKDDAAGEAIANRMTSNINGLTQASRNANDGISLAQTTEGALDEINDNLQAIRTLTVQAQTGTNSSSDLQSIQDEITQRLSEVDRISQQTDFNGVKVLSSDKSLSIQVGANDGETISIDLQQVDSKTLGLGTFNVNGTVGQTNTVKAGTVGDLTTVTDVADGDSVSVGGTTVTETTANLSALSVTDSAGNAISGGKLVKGNDNNYYIETGSGTSTTMYKVDSISSDGTSVKVSGATTGDSTTGFVPDSDKTLTDVTAANTTVTLGGTTATIADPTSLTFKDDSGKTISGGTLVTDASGKYYVETSDGLYDAQSVSSDGSTITVGNKTAGTTTGGVFSEDTTASTINGTDVTSISISDTSGNNSSALTGGTLVEDADGNYFVQDSDGNSYAATVSIDSSTGAVSVTADSTKAITSPATTDSLATLDHALSEVDTLRSNLGAIQNRLDSTIDNLSSTTTNLSEAQSRIQDADYATEVSNMSKAQILQQAGTSVLAQANQVPQTVLSLLK